MAGIQDFVNGSVLTETAIDEVAKQAIPQYATAAARNADATLTAALREGLTVYLLDVNCYSVYTGSTWSAIGPVHGAMLAWTPVITQSGTVTATMTSPVYSRVGRTVRAWMPRATMTGAGTAANPILVSLPVACSFSVGTIGTISLYSTSDSTWRSGIATLSSASTVGMLVGGTSGGFTSAPTLAAGDLLTIAVTYEAAADADA